MLTESTPMNLKSSFSQLRYYFYLTTPPLTVQNIFPFGMGYFFVPWWMDAGPKTVWSVAAGIQAGLGLLGILFYIYGKKMRAYWSNHRFLRVPDIKH